MQNADRLILVIDDTEARADNLKELIEFMDTPAVCACGHREWRQRLGNRRLEALFVDSRLDDSDIEEILSDVCKLDPNVPIIVTGGKAAN